MTSRQRSVSILGFQVLLVLAVFGKLEWDRATLPRVWARTVPIDPEDVLRGRYVRLWLDAADRRSVPSDTVRVEFAAVDSQLVIREARGWEGLRVNTSSPASVRGVVVAEPVAFFIPESAPDPSRLEPGQELWVEVSVPPHGMPRPIRVEVRSRE
jgi:hypothetical protein